MKRRITASMPAAKSTIKSSALTLALAAALLGATAFNSGCILAAAAVGAGAAAGGVLYVKGELQADLSAPPDKATAASKKALTDMSMIGVAATGTAVDGLVTARTANDKRIEVTIKGKGGNQSSVGIRVGIFGDEEVSRSILARIQDNLKG
ncbi:MAG: DUF3568 family protein [Planctomycetota bacterium]|nr:DUF3568 family protein [Planctomycetota bacterium]